MVIKNRIYFVVLILFVFLLAPSQTNSRFTVKNVKGSAGNFNYFYSLPETVLRIKVEFIQKDFIPGPYSQYADECLGIINVSSLKKTSYSIDKIFIETELKPDPNHFYGIVLERGNLPMSVIEDISEKKLILNMSFFSNETSTYNFNQNHVDKIVYKDLGFHEKDMIVQDTVYKRVLKDSVFIDIPYLVEKTMPRSYKSQVDEAAKNIYNIRNQKKDMLLGFSDISHNEGIKYAIEELDKLENEYLALFTGKTYTKTFERIYTIAPHFEGMNHEYILFRFSDTEGEFSATSFKGQPVFLNLQKDNITQYISEVKDISNKENIILYRIPEVVSIRISYNNEDYYITDKYVNQLGKLIGIVVN